MYAVIQTGSKQYKIEPGLEIEVNKIHGNEGDKVVFEDVLFFNDSNGSMIGTPFLSDISVTGRILCHDRDKKIIVFKKKRRKGYKRKMGHRQYITRVLIEDIKKVPKAKSSTTE